jgi:hypothetical protein
MEGEAAEVERAEPAAKKSKDDVAALSAWMVENGWSVLDFERHLVEKRAAQPSRLKSLPLEASQLDVFDLHVPNEVWELLCTVVNRNIVAGRSHCVDSRRRDATIAEMKGWYAIQIAIENTWGNDTKMLEKHLSVVKEKYGAIAGLGGDRFRIISAACVPTADELKRLAELLEDAAKKQLEVVRVLAIDEMVIGYAPRKETQLDAEKEGEPIPTVYVPRKPHPNGLECFLACTYVENPGNAAQVPYVCSIVPHLKANDYTSIGAAEKIVRGWPEALGKPHYFADAAFGNIRLVSETAGTGSEMTAPVSANHLGVLWRALSCSLPTGCWRAAVNRSQRLVASVHCGVDGDGHRTYQNVLSTNWTCEVPAPQADQQSQPAPQGEPQALVVRAAAKIIPRYTRDTLKGQKLAELKEICKVHIIRPSGTRKEDVIAGIMARVEIVHKKLSSVEEMSNILLKHWFKGAGPLHMAYKDNFNWVDLTDRAWNAVEEHHYYKHWSAKYLRLLMRLAVYNSMVHSQQNHGQTWLQFRTTLVSQIISSLKKCPQKA